MTYVAPEVVLNKGEDPNTREGYNIKADVWSLGVILYILYTRVARHVLLAPLANLGALVVARYSLSGRPPFYDDTPQGVLMRIRAADYDFPATEWDYVSKEGRLRGLGLRDGAALLTHACDGARLCPAIQPRTSSDTA